MASKGLAGVEIDHDRVARLVRQLRDDDRRPDKAMRREFRQIAADIVPKARAAVSAAHPVPKPGNVRGEFRGRKRSGEYKWATLVKTVRSGADSDTPYVVYGSDRTPGWAGWEFGSSRYKQFPPRSARRGKTGNSGFNFYPAVEKETDDIEAKAEAIVRKYEAMVD